jgi:hypothetical protein
MQAWLDKIRPVVAFFDNLLIRNLNSQQLKISNIKSHWPIFKFPNPWLLILFDIWMFYPEICLQFDNSVLPG